MTVYREPKINLEEVVQEINTKYKINLKNILQDEKVGYKDIYIYLYILAQGVLQKNPDLISNEKTVDVRRLATDLGVEVIESKLDSFSSINKVSIQNSYIGFFDGYGGINTIGISRNDGPLKKRYNITIMLAYYIISKIKNNQKNNMHFFDAYFLKIQEQDLCEILASFILMPIDMTLEIMRDFIEEEYIYNDIYDMSNFISSKMGISAYHEPICFNHIRCLGEILYNYSGELEIQDICQKVKSYEDLFKGKV